MLGFWDSAVSESSPRTGYEQAQLGTGQPGFPRGDLVTGVPQGEQTKLSYVKTKGK